MAGSNILVAASIAPQTLVSAQLGTTDVALYTTAALTSVKVAHGTLCNVTNLTAPPVLTLGATSTTGGTLAAGTYYWKITAKTSTGETIASNEVSATTTGTTSSQTLSWAAVAGAATYNVYRGTSSGYENNLFGSPSATSYTDTGVSGTTVYPPSISSYGYAVTVFFSIIKAGGTIGDGTHRIISNYSLGASDTISLRDYVSGAMLGPGDAISGFAGYAGAVDVVITGTVQA